MTDYFSDTDVSISGTSFASAIPTLATARSFTVSILSSLTHYLSDNDVTSFKQLPHYRYTTLFKTYNGQLLPFKDEGVVVDLLIYELCGYAI